MSSLLIDEVKPGMVLTEDVRMKSGHVLLKKDMVLQEGHIRNMVARGVKEIHAEFPPPPLSPEEQQRLLDRSEEFLQPFFQFVDHDHEAIEELYRISLTPHRRQVVPWLDPSCASPPR